MSAKIRTGILIGFFSLLFLSACVSTHFSPAENFDARKFPPVSPTAVRVLRSAPNEPFQTLGEIKVETAPFQSGETVILKARERAATIGADVIFFKGALSSAQSAEDGTYQGKVASVTFTAIRLLPSALRSP